MAGTRITFPFNGSSTEGYLATPESGKGPGILVLQEWWGLVPHIEAICDRFAAEGFTALAPDMYQGKTTTSPDDAGKLMMALNIAETEKNLRGAVDYLTAHDAVDGSKIGSVGFCMGGQLSLYAASKNPSIGAAVVYYGIHPNVHPDFNALQAPVMGFFGENDPMVTPEVTDELEKTLLAAGKQAEFHTYPADHAFFNDTRPDVYNEAAAADSWRRMLAFYRTHLS